MKFIILKKYFFIVILLFPDSLILNDGFLNFTLLRLINFDLPVLPVRLPALCAAIDTKRKKIMIYQKTI